MLILTCMLYNTDSCEGPYRKKKKKPNQSKAQNNKKSQFQVTIHSQN